MYKKFHIKAALSVLLALVMMLCMLTACGAKGNNDTEANPDPTGTEDVTGTGDTDTEDEDNTGTILPDDEGAAGGFDQDETTDPTESDAPDDTETPDSENGETLVEHTGTYGGIPIQNIVDFGEWIGTLDGVKFPSAKNDTKNKTLVDGFPKLGAMADDDIILWLDKNLIGVKSSDYNTASQEDIDNARNAAIYRTVEGIVRDAMLGPEGLTIYDRWTAIMDRQDSQNPDKQPDGQTTTGADAPHNTQDIPDASTQSGLSLTNVKLDKTATKTYGVQNDGLPEYPAPWNANIPILLSTRITFTAKDAVWANSATTGASNIEELFSTRKPVKIVIFDKDGSLEYVGVAVCTNVNDDGSTECYADIFSISAKSLDDLKDHIYVLNKMPWDGAGWNNWGKDDAMRDYMSSDFSDSKPAELSKDDCTLIY